MKKDNNQEIFLISVLALTITVLWVYLSVYRTLNKKEAPILTTEETKMLVPQLDNSVFEELGQRRN